MKYCILPVILAGFLAVALLGAGKGPEIAVIDGKVSIDAEAVPLGRLLQLLDRATGLQSTVPPALANRNLSVKFSDLSFDEAVRKIFEGQPIDYVVIARQGIVVTALSQAPGPQSAQTPVYNQPLPQIDQPSFIVEVPAILTPPPGFIPPQPPAIIGAPVPGAPVNSPFNPQQQPAMIQTPFGPIPNPRANQPIPQGAFPGQIPGQNPFGAAAPFTNPFGSTPPAVPSNNVFGNTSPPLFNQNQPAK
jgi:hypothetical protein